MFILKLDKIKKPKIITSSLCVLQDPIFSKETAKQLYDMHVKYETNKNEKENALLQKDNELKTIPPSKSRLTHWLHYFIYCIIVINLNKNNQ